MTCLAARSKDINYTPYKHAYKTDAFTKEERNIVNETIYLYLLSNGMHNFKPSLKVNTRASVTAFINLI